MHTAYKIYYRERGIRYVSELINLRETVFDKFPSSALFHYVPGENGHPEVDVEQPYFQGYSKKITLDYVTDYVQTEGGVRKPMFNLPTLIRNFRRENMQKWQYLPNAWKTDHNPESLQVINYGYLDVIHHYLPMQLSTYHRWLNRQRTVWAKAAEIARESERQQFIFFPIPSLLQGRTILDKYAQEPVTIKVMQIFGSHGWAGFMQLDLWRWLDESTRSMSLISQIDPKNYTKINLVFQGSSGSQAILNLGYFNSWIKGQSNITDAGKAMQFDKKYMKNVFLKLCMTLNAMLVDENPEAEAIVPDNQAVVPEPKITREPEAAKPDAKPADEVLFDDQKTTELENDSLAQDEDSESQVAVGPVHAQISKNLKAVPTQDSQESMHRPEFSKELMDDLQKDIEALDHISLKQLQVSGIKLTAVDDVEVEPAINVEEVKKDVFVPSSAESILHKRLDVDAEDNLLTASDYRKLKELTKQYLTSEDPYGSKLPRMQAMKIVPEDIALKSEDLAITDKAAVPDKSMNESSLQQFDKQYLKKVYKKDILQSVNAIQSAGVVIKRHEIDVTHSALGSYEQHTLELKPVDGAPSVLQFTFPKIEEDGTFMASGNKYLLRKQRIDVPLRKIAPTIVALSSYYGKTFVQTNPKVANSSLSWLYRQINLASFDKDNFITEVNPSDVFDNDFKAPYIYNALAQEYGQIKTQDVKLDFDHRNRQSIDSSILKSLEKQGRVYCGVNNKNDPIVVDLNNEFLIIGKQAEVTLGNIYEVLHLDTTKCPIDLAEVRVFSKYIPVGVVLSYYLGFSKLIALLGEEYRIVEGRKQKNLEKDEYAISFKDESFIFKTTNKLNSMILSGFNDFEKTLKFYDRKEFEYKDVYLNLLMSKGMAAIYLRELDMLENCFIDPITLEILQDMKEPTTFKGLLIRSCVLLKTYHHPSSQDRTVMRDRGYERFAGALYKELMTATRQFRNKNLVGRSKIDMSPYQVWNAIMKDSSLKIVEDTNPVQNLKEAEVITFAGTGGRDKDTMTKPTRAFHKNDVGVLSESTVDSSSVGTIAYLSANPNIKDVRGLMKDEKNITPTSMLSTSALLSPAAMNDNQTLGN